MCELNDDVWTVVLLRLTLTQLLKFRVICKSWRDIIDSSYFRKLHAQNQLSNDSLDDDPVLLQLTYRYNKFQKLSIIHVDTGKSYNDFPLYGTYLRDNIIVQFSRPVHGLICLYKEGSTDPIALCNPSLGEIKILPPSPTPCPSNVAGLCYDDVENDFKVVQFTVDYSRSSLFTTVEVYSRKRNAWRVLTDHTIQRTYFISKQLQHMQPSSAAVAHWRGWAAEGTEGVGRLKGIILSFDMRNEMFDVIKIPTHGCTNHVFARENSSFIMLILQNEEVIICEYKYKREWIKLGKIGQLFGQRVWMVAPWKNDGFILEIYSRKNKLDLYRVISEQTFKFIIFTRDSNVVDMVEYRGSFISP